jgi:hypothetical protein
LLRIFWQIWQGLEGPDIGIGEDLAAAAGGEFSDSVVKVSRCGAAPSKIYPQPLVTQSRAR